MFVSLEKFNQLVQSLNEQFAEEFKKLNRHLLAAFKKQIDDRLVEVERALLQRIDEKIGQQTILFGGGQTINLADLSDLVWTRILTKHPELLNPPKQRAELNQYESADLVERIYQDIDNDTIQELLAANLKEQVYADLDKGAVADQIATAYLEEADLDDLAEKVAAQFAGRLQIHLAPEEE